MALDALVNSALTFGQPCICGCVQCTPVSQVAIVAYPLLRLVDSTEAFQEALSAWCPFSLSSPSSLS